MIAPEEPGEQISRDEFQELVRDLDVEDKPSSAGPARRGKAPTGAAGVAQKAPPAEPERSEPQPPQRDPTADLTPEDLVLKDDKPAPKRKRPRNKRHGRR